VPRMAFSEVEAAQMLGVEVHVLREQRRLGRIEHCRGPGRRIMYTREQIEAYLRRSA
jgi:predicted site-specific integrase-resolvase